MQTWARIQMCCVRQYMADMAVLEDQWIELKQKHGFTTMLWNVKIELEKICSLNFHLRTYAKNSNSNAAWNWMILWPDSYHFLLWLMQENRGLDQARTVASISCPHCFYGVKYRCKVECNLMQECNLSVVAWHLACCGPAVHILTLPFMLLPVPSWW